VVIKVEAQELVAQIAKQFPQEVNLKIGDAVTLKANFKELKMEN
jgi:hypothetical protein